MPRNGAQESQISPNFIFSRAAFALIVHPMIMATRLEELLDKLRGSEPLHLDVGLRMMKADGGAVFPLDLLALAVLNRSSNLVPAFASLVESRNFISAVPLLRLQIDNCLRFYAAYISENPHDFATAVLGGEHVRRMRDKHGNKMTDAYLVERFSEEFSWAKNVYEKTSGYIHLSDAHIANIFKQPIGEASEETVQELVIGPGDNFAGDCLYEEAVEAFIAATEAMFHYLVGWVGTKASKGIGGQTGVPNS